MPQNRRPRNLGGNPSSLDGTGTFRRLIFGTSLYGLTLKGKTPTRLRGAPPDSWPGDPKTGKIILHGKIPVNGDGFSTDDTLWKNARSPDEITYLHGFSWLSDLRTQDKAEAKALARNLIEDWINHHQRWSGVPWRADILGSRISNWLAGSNFICDGAGENFNNRFLTSIAEQTRHLVRICPGRKNSSKAFEAIKGLIYGGVCLPGHEEALETAIRFLETEITRQIFPDGGHMDRCPSTCLSVLRNLVDIREVLTVAQVDVPELLQLTIEHMATIIRFFRLGDGKLALFNGGAEETGERVDLTLAQAAGKGGAKVKPPVSASHTGFQRLTAGRTIIVADTGKPSGIDPYAGTLSFEMSVAKDRMIVNQGPFGPEGEAMTATQAHSTLTVDNRDSSTFRPDGRIKQEPKLVTCEQMEGDGNVWLVTSHDGYPGIVHQRRLYLAAEGFDFRGEDTLSGSGGKTFQIHFHLHPAIHASLVENASAVLLKLPNGSGWRFRASGGTIALEESRYAGNADFVRRSEQIVVAGPIDKDETLVKWAFRRETK